MIISLQNHNGINVYATRKRANKISTDAIYEIFVVCNLLKPLKSTSTVSRVFWFTQKTSENISISSKLDKGRRKQELRVL